MYLKKWEGKRKKCGEEGKESEEDGRDVGVGGGGRGVEGKSWGGG